MCPQKTLSHITNEFKVPPPNIKPVFKRTFTVLSLLSLDSGLPANIQLDIDGDRETERIYSLFNLYMGKLEKMQGEDGPWAPTVGSWKWGCQSPQQCPSGASGVPWCLWVSVKPLKDPGAWHGFRSNWHENSLAVGHYNIFR
jgi:hypothetical protein